MGLQATDRFFETTVGGIAVQPGDELVGRYRVEARLGHGGMGEVWRGVDQKLRRPIAVKVLLNLSADPALLQRFQREAVITAGLQHPGIAVVHDVDQHDGQLFIVMELLHGQDLGAVLAGAPSGLPISEAISLTMQAARALVAAHIRGVVHRDLKPANLFLLTEGRLKVCDFGIARAVDATSALTATGQVFGTPAYMSPEQWSGEQVDARSDLYSLGCVLHALLTGQPPFPPDQAPLALMRQHLDIIPAGPRAVRFDVSPELDRLVLELLAKDPAARPAGADLVVTALETIEDLLSARAVGTDPVRTMRLLDRAEQIALTLTNDSLGRNSMLWQIATAMAGIDSSRAEQIARTITNEHERDRCLFQIVRVVAGTDAARAEQIARTIAADPIRAEALVEVAVRATAPDYAQATFLFDEAESLARASTDGWVRAHGLLGIAVMVIDVDRARMVRLLDEAEHAARTIDNEDLRGSALVWIAKGADGADRTLAMRLLNDAERLARTITDDNDRAGRLHQVAQTMARVGTDLVRAEQIARTVTSGYWQVQVLVEIATAAAAGGEPARAARLLGDTERLARTIDEEYERATRLAEVATAMARTDLISAERIVRTISEEYRRAEALVGIAMVVSDSRAAEAARLLDDAEHLAHSARVGFRHWPLAKLAAAMAGTDPARAEQIARTIVSEYDQAQALIEVATLVADIDPARTVRLLDDVERLSDAVTREYQKASVLVGIARASQKLGRT
jgi:serine/threonine protein kinase